MAAAPTLVDFPTASPWPTLSPWPTVSAYPTASGTPTASPFPTVSTRPSSRPTYYPTLTSWPTISFYPTASATPTASPFPTTPEKPSRLELDSSGAGVRQSDVSSAPTSIIDVMVNKFIDDGRSPDSESGVHGANDATIDGNYGSTLAPMSELPSEPTNFPTTTAFPTHTFYPTASGTPTASPWPTFLILITDSPTMIKSPTKAPTPGSSSVKPVALNLHNGSTGYTRSCPDFVLGSDQSKEELVFTYIAESSSPSVDFLTELEIQLLDHVFEEALGCTGEENLLPKIYQLNYHNDQAASEASPCEPTHPSSNACWILQTRLFVISDNTAMGSAKRVVLENLQELMDHGAMMTKSFTDLSFLHYLGPDPREGPTSGKPLPHANEGDSEGLPRGVFVGVMVVMILGIATLMAAIALIAYRRRKGWLLQPAKAPPPDDERSEASMEISELLSESKRRLKERPPVPVGANEQEIVDKEDDLDIGELLSTTKERVRHAPGNGRFSFTGTSRSSSRSEDDRSGRRRYSAAARGSEQGGPSKMEASTTLSYRSQEPERSFSVLSTSQRFKGDSVPFSRSESYSSRSSSSGSEDRVSPRILKASKLSRHSEASSSHQLNSRIRKESGHLEHLNDKGRPPSFLEEFNDEPIPEQQGDTLRSKDTRHPDELENAIV